MFRKLCISAAALVAASLCLGGTASAASDPSSGNKLDRLQPLVQPSVVYETIKWKAQIWDTHNKQYIPTKVGGKPAEFTVSYRCTGYVVNPAGWIATAGHCVDPREARDDLIKEGVAHALSTGFYPQATSVDQLLGLIEYRANSFDDEGHLRRNQPDRTIITSWGASVSGVEIAKSKPALRARLPPARGR